ncbi:hypothetical protein [Mycolicibacterium komossense]|uniref:Uncharacterized protein n=1 Tax=Mycolicibacterium komossense TaxID=1779 RepID=A0ABT3CMY7_9MYCO|nr:hypothetical protein [Mycolicibacterium komossense]MCV7230718.1 hypothetical protein [Mycolicibacterium komossense]
MSAVARNVLDVPIGLAAPARPSKFFAALDQADQKIAQFEQLQWTASFAPPITSFAKCVCGATFEVRGHGGQIEATDDEQLEAAEAVADLFGRALLDVDLRVVARVIDKINHERAIEHYDALRDWESVHADCGDGP